MNSSSRSSRTCLLALAATLCAGLSAPAEAAVTWRLTLLAPPAGQGAVSFATGLNDLGDVVAASLNRSSGAASYAGAWLARADGSVQSLVGPEEAAGAFASGINDRGLVVGYLALPYGTAAVTWTPGAAAVNAASLLPVDFYARGVNNAGEIVGHDANGNAYRWANDQLTALSPPLPAYSAYALSINDTGSVLYSDGRRSLGLLKPGHALYDDDQTLHANVPKVVDPLVGPLGNVTTRLNMTTGSDASGPSITFDVKRSTAAGQVIARDWIPVKVAALPSGDSLAIATAMNNLGQIAGMSASGKAALATPQGSLVWRLYNGVSASADFNDAANWSLSDNPALDDPAHSQPLTPSRLIDARIVGGSPVTLSGGADVRNLYVGDAQGVTYGGSGPRQGALQLLNADLRVQGGIQVEANGGFSAQGGSLTMGLDASLGPAKLEAGTSSRVALQNLTVAGGDVIAHGDLLMNNLRVVQGQVLIYSNRVTASGLIQTNIYNEGHVSVQGDNTLFLDSTIANEYEVVVQSNDATFRNVVMSGQGGLSVNGRLTLDHSQIGKNQSVSVTGSLISNGAMENARNAFVATGGRLLAEGYTQSAGHLIVDGTLDSGGGLVRLLGGDLAGNGRINGSLFIGGGPGTAVFKPGHSPGSFAVSGDIDLLPGGDMELDVATAPDGHLITDHVSAAHMNLNGTIHLKLAPGLSATSGSLNLFDCGSGCDFGNQFSYAVVGDATGTSFTFGPKGLTVSISPVPEPGSAALLLAGLGLLVPWRWRVVRRRPA